MRFLQGLIKMTDLQLFFFICAGIYVAWFFVRFLL